MWGQYMSDLPELKGNTVLLRKPKDEDIDTRTSFGLPTEYAKCVVVVLQD